MKAISICVRCMQITSCLFFLIGTLISTQSIAAILIIDVSAEMTSTSPRLTSIVPKGTVVTSSLNLSIPEGNYGFLPGVNGIDIRTSQVSGTFSWLIPDVGPQTFFVQNIERFGASSSGAVRMGFLGIGPTINGVLAKEFILEFDIGINPFSEEANTTDLSELIFNSTISKMRVVASEMIGSSTLNDFGDLTANVNGKISAVPIPAAIWFFGSSLVGLLGFRSLKS